MEVQALPTDASVSITRPMPPIASSIFPRIRVAILSISRVSYAAWMGDDEVVSLSLGGSQSSRVGWNGKSFW